MKNIINIEFLKKKNSCKKFIDFFRKKINKDIDLKDIIHLLIKTYIREQIIWCDSLLRGIFDMKCRIKYEIYIAEISKPYANKTNFSIINYGIKSARDFLENDCVGDKKFECNDPYTKASIATCAAETAADDTYAVVFSSYVNSDDIYYPFTKDFAYDIASRIAADAANATFKNTLIKIIYYGLALLDDKCDTGEIC